MALIPAHHIQKNETPKTIVLNGEALQAFEIAWRDVSNLIKKSECKKLEDYEVYFEQENGLREITFYPKNYMERPKKFENAPWKFGVCDKIYIDSAGKIVRREPADY